MAQQLYEVGEVMTFRAVVSRLGLELHATSAGNVTQPCEAENYA